MPSYTYDLGRPAYIVCLRRYCRIAVTSLLFSAYSKVCGHSFSGKAIKDYLGNSRIARKVCPTAGCNKVISLADLQEDKDLKRKAENAARRERMREEEDEDDDVVE